MSNSFVKRAPEIAEEILLKAADSRLPGDLKAFSKSLLNKEASDDREKLVAPARMSLADLQKVAHENKTVLPTVTVSSVDDWADTAAILTKVASDHEAANGREIFENATALVATKEAAQVRVPKLRVAPQAVHAPQPQSIFKRLTSRSAQMEHAHAEANFNASMAAKSGTKQHADAAAAASLKSDSARKDVDAQHARDMQSRRADVGEKAVTHAAPLMAAAIGVPMALQAMKRDPAKKEEVKIYK